MIFIRELFKNEPSPAELILFAFGFESMIASTYAIVNFLSYFVVNATTLNFLKARKT